MNNINDFKKALHEGIVNFTYIKKDGSTREAKGTLQEKFITVTSTGTNTRPKPDNIVAYWDLDKNAWRSFITDNLQKFEIVNE